MIYNISSRLTPAFMAVVLFAGNVYAGSFIEPDKDDKCPVCGMFVYKYPEWTAEIIFQDGTYAVFDGPKDMLRYYFDVSKYNSHKTRDDIAGIYVTEYYSTEHTGANDVFFVTGSDVYGPMGEELVPVKGREAAEAFRRDHKGKDIKTFDQITPADIPGMKMIQHKGHGKN